MAEKLKKPANSNKITKEIMIPIIVVAAVILVVAGVVGFFKWRDAQQKKEYDQVVQQATSLTNQEKYNDVENLITNYQKKNIKKTYEYDTLIILGSNYQNLNNTKASYETFKKAEQLQPANNVLVLNQLAYLSLSLGDKAAAKDYFTRLIKASKEDRELSNDAYIPIYEQALKDLEQ